MFGIIADKFGRRRVILTSAILNTLFGVLTAFSPSYYWILLARTLVGFALSGAAQGYFIFIIFTYSSFFYSNDQCGFRSTLMLEYLPTNTRATIIIVIELFWSLGGIFEYLLAMLLVENYGWRVLTLVSALPISIVALCMYVSKQAAILFFQGKL